MITKSTTALSKELQVTTKPGILKLASIAIDSTAASGTYYIQFFDSASTPADATSVASNMPRVVKVVHTTGGKDSEVAYNFIDNAQTQGVRFSTGLYVCISTTQFTKTLVGSNVANIEVEVI